MENKAVYIEEDKDCALYGTEECRLMNSESCLECYVGLLLTDEQKRLKAALGHMLEEVPQAAVEELYSGDECLLCKSGNPNKSECYALIDLAKQDEQGDWTFSLEKKRARAVKGSSDMLLPLHVSCCKKCRSRYRVMEFVPYIVGIFFSLAGLIIATANGIRAELYQAIGAWAPFGLFAALTLAGIGAGLLLRKLFISAYGKKTRMSANEIAAIALLENKGWRELYPKRTGVSKFAFANALRSSGIYTAVTQGKAEADDPDMQGQRD